MLTYDWIVLITLGKDKWEAQRQFPKSYELERDAAQIRGAAEAAAKAETEPEPTAKRPGLLRRLFARRMGQGAAGAGQAAPSCCPSSRAAS
ncbi:hypothetical protein [Phaeobacter inhibens]|uniref:hypothetical protein n=1 Tax=Phaeobacter inhibens TaxID=221822 RepID=UPI00248FC5FB|nr:hypothetical protein [Phaeobacter inhibens]